MMNDKEYAELKLRAMIVPKQASWPAPEYLHWQRLHEAANEARERVSKFYTLADGIDRNAALSREDKARQRHRVAMQVFAEFEASKTLARAREAVELAVAKHNVEQHVSPEIAEARDAMKDAEQGWQKAIDKIAERVSLPDTRRNPPWGVYSKSSLPHRR
jgi:hypothetical protein